MTTFIVETVVMLVIIWLVMKYVWPLLKTMMEARQEEIGKALAAAEAARSDAANAEQERQVALAEGRQQAADVVEQARRNAAQITAESGSRAQAEYHRIVANAHAEVLLQRQRAVDEAASELGDVVMDVVAKVIDREADAEVHQSLIDQAVRALNASGAEGAGKVR